MAWKYSPRARCPTVEECTRLAGEADLLAGIIAWRYGWEPEGEVQSITELEYDAAKERLMFIIDDSSSVNTKEEFDSGPDTWKKQDKLAAFKSRVADDQMLTSADLRFASATRPAAAATTSASAFPDLYPLALDPALVPES